jgi:hypothetical protein
MRKVKPIISRETLLAVKTIVAIKLVLILFVWLFHSLIPFNHETQQYNYYYQEANITLGNLLSSWDGQWYLSIADSGYSKVSQELPYIKYMFFPLYPSLIAMTNLAVGNLHLSGLLLSFFCVILSGIMLYKLIKLDWEKEVAYFTLLLYLIFPSLYFL